MENNNVIRMFDPSDIIIRDTSSVEAIKSDSSFMNLLNFLALITVAKETSEKALEAFREIEWTHPDDKSVKDSYQTLQNFVDAFQNFQKPEGAN